VNDFFYHHLARHNLESEGILVLGPLIVLSKDAETFHKGPFDPYICQSRVDTECECLNS
jgi:hypothetical protein